MPRIIMPSDVLDRMEGLAKAQLRMVQEIRHLQEGPVANVPVLGQRRKPKRRGTHVDLAYQVLVLAGTPLHVYEIVRQIQDQFTVTVKWESVVSTLVKKAAQGQQFIRTGRNTFGLVGRDQP